VLRPNLSPSPQRGAPATLEDFLGQRKSARAAAHAATRAAEAVAAYHARDRVHGALRPAALAVKPDGGVAVEAPAAAVAAEERLDALRYAAPEVARGAAPTAAADVFSLGLVIRTLLEGDAPRRTTGDDLLRDAVEGRCAPLAVDVAGTEELRAVLERAVDVDPAGRPAAPEFVAALRGAFHPRGLQRQEWIIGALAAAAVLLLVVLLHRSSSERDRSARQFEDTRAAVEGLLAGTYPELGRIEDIEAVAGAGRSALASLARLRETDSNPAADALYARALLWNGEVERRIGRHELAREHYDAAVEIAGERPTRDLDAAVALPALVGLAELAMDARDAAGASALLDRAIAVGGAPAEGDPRALRLLRARALASRGEVAMATGGRDGGLPAEEAFARAREDLAPFVGAERDREALSLAARLGRLEANDAALRGDFDAAARILEEAVDVTERLVRLDPGSVEARHADARVHDVLGRARVRLGDYPDATEAFRAAIEGWRLLVQMDSRADRWRAERMRTMRELATSLDRIGEPGEASALHDLALEEARELIAAGALGPAAGLELSAHALTAAEGRLAAGDLRGARERLDAASEGLGARTGAAPSVRHRDLVARRDVIASEIALARGSWDEAEVAANRFLELHGRLARNGRASGLRECRVRAMLVTASIRAARGQRDEARDMRRSALGVVRRLVEENGDDVPTLALLARTLFVLGEDAEAAQVLARLDAAGYRGLELSAVRAATAHIRRR